MNDHQKRTRALRKRAQSLPDPSSGTHDIDWHRLAMDAINLAMDAIKELEARDAAVERVRKLFDARGNKALDAFQKTLTEATKAKPPRLATVNGDEDPEVTFGLDVGLTPDNAEKLAAIRLAYGIDHRSALNVAVSNEFDSKIAGLREAEGE